MMEQITINAPAWLLIFFAVLLSVKGSLDIASVVLSYIKERNKKTIEAWKLIEARKPAENPLNGLDLGGIVSRDEAIAHYAGPDRTQDPKKEKPQ
jgi:hypothetical protein